LRVFSWQTKIKISIAALLQASIIFVCRKNPVQFRSPFNSAASLLAAGRFFAQQFVIRQSNLQFTTVNLSPVPPRLEN
jgi:hypothetical protein